MKYALDVLTDKHDTLTRMLGHTDDMDKARMIRTRLKQLEDAIRVLTDPKGRKTK